MNPDTLRAHHALHGQTLLPEWQQTQAMYVEGDRRILEGIELRAASRRLRAEANRPTGESRRLRAEGDRLYAEGGRQYVHANILWRRAVREHFGDVPIHWDGTTCIVAGERYTR